MNHKVLMLGGPLHLKTLLSENFSTPISHCTANEPPIRYHRAVFHLPAESGVVDCAWYIYVTDEYQTSPDQLSANQIAQVLEAEGISPVIKAVPASNLQNELRIL